MRRGSAHSRGYTSRWAKASALYRQAHPLCLGCKAVGRRTATAVTDHIVPHGGDQVLFWDEANWQPACQWHHDHIKQALERRWERGGLKATDLRLDSRVAIEMTRKSVDLDDEYADFA